MGSRRVKVNRSVIEISVALLASSIFIGLLAAAPPALAEPMFDSGLHSYNQQEYKKAIAYFNIAISRNPENVDAIYYHALSCQALGDQKTAIRDYASIISHNPNSQAGQYAARALAKWDPSYLRQLQRASTGGGAPPHSPPNGSPGGGRVLSSGTSMKTYMRGSSSGGGAGAVASDIASLPEGSTVYFRKGGGGSSPLLMVPATINGQQLEMCFDTGANGVVVGKNHLADLHIPPPTGAPTGSAGGVGSDSPSAVWIMTATIKVGQISRTLPIMVYENMSAPPLLGQTFFNAFTYEIDNGAQSIRFRKKNAGGNGGNYGNGVPFERDPHNPNHQIVTAFVNGHPMKMFFDTGAQGCTFTYDQAKAAGIHIPDDAETENSIGVGGTTAGVAFNIESLRMGPISKSNFRISVVRNATMPFPLMGQSFFNDYTTFVDEAHSAILFKRAQ